jgi:hypothetical protein
VAVTGKRSKPVPDVSDGDRRTRWYGALAGVAAAAVALGFAELVAAVVGPRSAPLIAVGGVVIDAAPLPVKEFATSTFGVHDKTALILGTMVLLAVYSAVVGAWSVRDIRIGYAGIALFGIIGVIAAVTRHGAGGGDALPSILGAAAGAAMLHQLIRGFKPGRPGPESQAGRRSLLTGSAVALVGATVVGLVGRSLGARRNVAEARANVVLPLPSDPAPALPAVPAPAGQSGFVTSNRDFYRIDTALVVPQVDPSTWTLRIHGRVAKSITLDYQQLLARPMIERYITLCCVSNPVGGDLIGNARFLGVPLKDLLEEAGPEPGADQVVGRSVDGFTAGSPTAVLMDGRDAMLVVGMNGAPLPLAHGVLLATSRADDVHTGHVQIDPVEGFLHDRHFDDRLPFQNLAARRRLGFEQRRRAGDHDGFGHAGEPSKYRSHLRYWFGRRAPLHDHAIHRGRRPVSRPVGNQSERD